MARRIALSSLVVATAFCLLAVAAEGAQLTEQAKIDALLQSIETRNDLKFIRLGSVHSSSEAAQMLRVKLRFAGSRVKTANDFVEHVANATVSGSPYYIVYPDGRRTTSVEFLRGELRRIDAGQAPQDTAKR